HQRRSQASQKPYIRMGLLNRLMPVFCSAQPNRPNSSTQQAAAGFVYSGQSNGQQIANTALENSINIAPTLSKNQGDTVSLIVAHDLDFSNVYKLQVNNSGGGYGG
ncbi:TrbI/VirB10 family protein, partial [Acidocella sp.]|uniref:TrbI/VirB10 family protein n=1 Tax=Acidocella sp. TaxID=50710 RepID=UPI00185ADAA7